MKVSELKKGMSVEHKTKGRGTIKGFGMGVVGNDVKIYWKNTGETESIQKSKIAKHLSKSLRQSQKDESRIEYHEKTVRLIRDSHVENKFIIERISLSNGMFRQRLSGATNALFTEQDYYEILECLKSHLFSFIGENPSLGFGVKKK